MIDSSLRHRVHNYMLAVELLVTELGNMLPVFYEYAKLLPPDRQKEAQNLFKRLEHLLDKVDELDG